MVNERNRLGLIPQKFQPVDDTVLSILASVSETSVDAPAINQDFGETIQTLRGDQTSIQSRLGELNQDIRAARTFLSAQTSFSQEATEQNARLKSIGLYKSDFQGTSLCPLFESELGTPIPNVEQINQSVRHVDNLLTSVHKECPHIQSYISELSDQIQ